MTLLTHHLHITFEVTGPLEIDNNAGSAVRGAVVNALLNRFCANQTAPTCADCPLVRVCPVAALVAPMRDTDEPGGEQRPRPYVIRPPQGRRYAPGESLTFGLGLFGRAAELFPYIVMAAHVIEFQGLGRRLEENRGRRGGVRLQEIDAINPLTGAKQPLFRAGKRQIQAPGIPIGPAEVASFAITLPEDRLTLRFLTPMRLIDGGRLVKQPALRPLLQRLGIRLTDLSMAYGDGPLPAADARALLSLAERAILERNDTRWIDIVSHSRRTGERTPIGGLVGEAVFSGNLAPLREILVWGSLVHVGKNAVKGDGWYVVER
ncbi:CRISPR system precrRNA processing endoribonuclease RAMP protein Cas6 [Roseiflexus sp.]|uniref:CRISPR system precrRNA processing endoribonuclease RAMP protein Cas6 n=1 Tax=Roseiflexus sp. TaxID=2562120 RepID=UPI00398B78DA